MIEFYNEFFFLCINYHLLLFTDLIDDKYLKYRIGYSVIIFLGFNLLTNMIIFIIQHIKKLMFICGKFKQYMKTAIMIFNQIKT